jgi:diguanylate cyclase (GGDEF)-like protein
VVDRTLHDSLTGLGNRVALMEELERLGDGLSNATFAALDIDRFKAIHASLGDAGGDAVLIGIAKRLSKRFAGVGEVFRVGGDGFAVLFTRPAGTPTAIGADLVETCAAPFPYRGRNVFAPTSVGVAAGGDAEDPLDLLKNAELALSEAKRHGGARAHVYSPDMAGPATADPVALEADLRRALEDEQIDVFYQPIIRLEDGTVAGFEALLRWLHPTRGVIEPGAFVAHSEETGLIVALGRFALERAARELSEWQRYFPVHPPLFVSVNLSRRQLREPEFCAVLEKMLSSGTFEPGTLTLELTESAAAGGDDVKRTLTRIRAMGASLAIDDFGTGTSTLGQLKDLPFDTLKIDKTFLSRHAGERENSEGSVVLSSIVALAHELRREVVVEGVERERDVAWLKSLGCEYAQGYFFSPPLPAAETLDFIARHHGDGDAKETRAG